MCVRVFLTCAEGKGANLIHVGVKGRSLLCEGRGRPQVSYVEGGGDRSDFVLYFCTALTFVSRKSK